MRSKFATLCIACGVTLIVSGCWVYINDTNRRHIQEIQMVEQKHKWEYNQMNEQIQELNQQLKKVNIENENLKHQLDLLKKNSPFPMTSTISRGGSFISMEYIGKYRATAYNLDHEDCGKYKSDKNYGITSSGAYVRAWHTVAMDQSIPMGTKIYIPYFAKYPNHGIFVKEDHGGAIKGNRIDIFIEDKGECNRFGVRYLDIYKVR